MSEARRVCLFHAATDYGRATRDGREEDVKKAADDLAQSARRFVVDNLDCDTCDRLDDVLTQTARARLSEKQARTCLVCGLRECDGSTHKRREGP